MNVCLFIPVQFHIAHLFEIQSKYELAKEAYQTIISVQGMPTSIQSAAWRQLGKVFFFQLKTILKTILKRCAL